MESNPYEEFNQSQVPQSDVAPTAEPVGYQADPHLKRVGMGWLPGFLVGHHEGARQQNAYEQARQRLEIAQASQQPEISE